MPAAERRGYASVNLRKVLLRNWFELPVYLQRSDDGGLDAGVRAIFNTGSDKFGLGAFIGEPF